MGKPGPGSDDSAKKKARRQRAAAAGPPGLAEKINPLAPSNEWVVEKKSRHDKAKKQYFKDKQRLHVKERHATARLNAQLESRKKVIDAHYKVKKLKESDSRLAKARRMARKNFDRYVKKTERKHREQWQGSYRNLRSQRDKQYHSITKTMRKEHRQERGLPDATQSPWKI